jgi:methylthioribose-1-phosphate isomerase
MLIDGRHFHTVWHDPSDPEAVHIIDQRSLPFRFETERLTSVAQAAAAISEMHVRGAGCIGATAAWGMYLAAREAPGRIEECAAQLVKTRPTAVNLAWAVQRQLRTISEASSPEAKVGAARRGAEEICAEDVAACRAIGQNGLPLIASIAAKRPGPVNILTHCNAGWLAFVDIGSATAPIYSAHNAGIPIHVWVDETRPRNQGARLTAWELAAHGVPHTLIADNAGGHLMQRGKVDMVITGADRVTRAGDVANKIGTYLKALAAKDCGAPFYVALPSSTFDHSITDGIAGIPIEERSADEVLFMEGLAADGREQSVRICAPGTPASNPAFDITPARLITGLITEFGICPATEEGIGFLDCC